MEQIRNWVGRQLGLRFEHERTGMLEHRLGLVCKKLKLSLPELSLRLEQGDPELAIFVAEEVSTNHTLFLREPEIFRSLTELILPALPKTGEMRIWSAAASSGEEAYSIAICASSELGGTAVQERLRILGTDISARQIQHAERGVYTRSRVANLPAELSGYFVRVDKNHVRVRSDVAALCVFRRMNLTRVPWPFSQRFHVVFLRNVLYYFDQTTRWRVLEHCYRATEPGGWLVTSVTEPMVDAPSLWVQVGPGIFRKPGVDGCTQ